MSSLKALTGGQAVPTTLKTAFLEPMAAELAPELCLGLFACNDKEYMQLFAGKSWHHVLM